MSFGILEGVMEYTFYALNAKYVKNVVYGKRLAFQNHSSLGYKKHVVFYFSCFTPTHDQYRYVTYVEGIRCDIPTSDASCMIQKLSVD